MKKTLVFGSVAAGLVVAGLVFFLSDGSYSPGRPKEPVSQGAPTLMHRLTEEQYRNSIRDIFGNSISVGGQFEPDPRVDGLIAIGAGAATITAAGFEKYDRIATLIADQVVSEKNRGQFIPCQPFSPDQADEACAREFLSKAGYLLFRRPLTESEQSGFTAIAAEGAEGLDDFYAGIKFALIGMLQSPQFVFWHEESEPDSNGGFRLTPYSMASRLSFLFWNTAPDRVLLDAAESGALQTREGLERQVERLMASPRFEDGIRAYFRDFLAFDLFENLAKDGQLYPNYSREAAQDMREQTLRTVVDIVVDQDGDYRDLFTTRKTHMTRLLASVYRLPLAVESYRLPDEWIEYEMPQSVPAAGILTQAAFVSLHSHPGTSSPTLRGMALRETLLCQDVPDPPANVDFSAFGAASHGESGPTTARDRLSLHSTEPACAGCHKITDPIGYSLESFDTVGGFRTTENGLAIDTSGTLDGTPFQDATGLGQAIHDNPATASCLVERISSYAMGRSLVRGDREWIDHLETRFASAGYRVSQLLRALALSSNFYRVAPEQSSQSVALAQ